MKKSRGNHGKRREHNARLDLEDQVPDDFHRFSSPSVKAAHGLKYDQLDFLEAVKRRSVNHVRSFLDQGFNPAFTILPDRTTPLHLAIQEHPSQDAASEKIIRLLLFFGCDPNASDNYGNTPLHVACLKQGADSYFSVDLLLQTGADVNPTNWNRETPLMIACSSREPCLNTVKILVQQGACIANLNQDKQNAIHLVCCTSLCRSCDFVERASIVTYLMEQGLASDTLDANGKTPLCYEFLRLVYFFNTTDDTHQDDYTVIYPKAISVALALVAGGGLANLAVHELDLKTIMCTMHLRERVCSVLRSFFLSIRNDIPMADFLSICRWIRQPGYDAFISYGFSPQGAMRLQEAENSDFNFSGAGNNDDEDYPLSFSNSSRQGIENSNFLQALNIGDNDGEEDNDDDRSYNYNNDDNNGSGGLVYPSSTSIVDASSGSGSNGAECSGGGGASATAAVSSQVYAKCVSSQTQTRVDSNAGGNSGGDGGGSSGRGTDAEDNTTIFHNGNSNNTGYHDTTNANSNNNISSGVRNSNSNNNGVTVRHMDASHDNNENSTSNSSNNNNNNNYDISHAIYWDYPPSLLLLSRMSIRKCLGGRVTNLVSGLGLPKKFECYVKCIE